MYTIHDQRTFYDVLVTRLLTTGRPVGEAVKPAAAGLPYAVIYPMTDVSNAGPLNDPTQVSVYQWQVTCVGQTMEQAQWMQHKVRSVLLGWIPTVSGIGTTPVDLAAGSGVTRDDDVSPPQFYTTDSYRLYTSG